MGDTSRIMKHKMLTMLAAAGGLLAFSATPTWAADVEEAAPAEVESNAVTVTTVQIQGGG